MSVVAALAVLLVAVGGPWPAAPVAAAEGGSRALSQERDLAVTLYRSWQAPNVTVIDGMFRVEPELGQAGGECRYAVELQVEDSAGAVLLRDGWDSNCPRAADGSALASLETFQFAVLPARYTLRVSVRAVGDAARVARTSVAVEGLEPSVRLSDLVLGSQVGWADSAGPTWTFRRGAIGILTASEVVVQADDPHLAYYVEVYADSAQPLSGRLVGAIKRPDGSEVVRVPLRELGELRQSAPVAGRMSVAGLPPGEYLLEARLELADTVLVRVHPFSMISPLLAADAPAEGGGYFASLSDEELAELFDPLVVWLQTEAERRRYESLSPTGRRAFLREYFGNVAPSGDPDSQAPLDVYLARVKYVQTAFRERVGRGAQEGWRTDRGRIYLRLGEPTSRVVQPRPQQGPPYEIWFYAIRSGYVYLFVDERGFGTPYLLYSNDPAENPMPGWEQRIGAEAIEDLAQFGIRVRSSTSP